MGAPCIPSNATIQLWFNNAQRNLQIYQDNQRLQRQDWQNTNPARGPVRGYPGRVSSRGPRGL